MLNSRIKRDLHIMVKEFKS